MEAHTNADDAGRYRDVHEVEHWRARDPISRLHRYLDGAGVLTPEVDDDIRSAAEDYAAALRTRMNADVRLDPDDLFAHVYVEPTTQLRAQRAALRAELASA